jgi:hypothetical protein
MMRPNRARKRCGYDNNSFTDRFKDAWDFGCIARDLPGRRTLPYVTAYEMLVLDLDWNRRS